MSVVWDFIQNQLLGMKWLNDLVGKLLTSLGMDITGWIGGAVQFFIYDTIKIFILLSFLIFGISYVQSYFPPERSKKILGRFKGIGANTVAALLGTVTPFCSCSSIPLFIGFTSAGLPLGVTFSFLISSPMVDLASLVLLMSIFGADIAIAYVVVGLLIAIIGGTIIEKMHMEKYVEEFIMSAQSVDVNSPDLTQKDRLAFAKEQLWETVKKVAPYIFIGVGVGALIHNVIPAEFIQKVLGENNPFSVIIATLFGIPIYADIFGTIPIAEALYAKGVGIGTVMALMMGVTTLSLPSIIMLRKAVKPKLLALFVGICTVGIAQDMAAAFSPAARKCGFKQGGYLCFEEDSQESVALRELLDKKLWAVPDRIKDKAAFEENINKSIREYNPDYWRARQRGLERASPPQERPPAHAVER